MFNEIIKMRLWDDKAKDVELNLASSQIIIQVYLNKYKTSLKNLL